MQQPPKVRPDPVQVELSKRLDRIERRLDHIETPTRGQRRDTPPIRRAQRTYLLGHWNPNCPDGPFVGRDPHNGKHQCADKANTMELKPRIKVIRVFNFGR